MKKNIYTIVLGIIVILYMAIILCGCAKTESASQTIANNAITATTALEQQLPAECKTDGIKTQMAVIKTEIRNVTKTCEMEKNNITRDKLKWKLSFWALIGVIGAYIAKKVLQ